MQPIVAARRLTRQVEGPVGTLTILSEVDLEIEAGEAVAIRGPSGSGKSTLLGQLAGLDSPTCGTVHLLGQDLSKLDEDGKAELRAGKVGFVFQMFHLLPGLTALENVELALELAHQGNRYSQAAQMLESVGLAARMRHLPLQLSGGEQQRVALARAFVIQPQVLFADEPTGNLDNDTGEAVADMLFALRRERESALVLVTHDTALASRCDRVLSMEAGRLKLAE
jgi:putative ABC transport system ATP-binding protein